MATRPEIDTCRSTLSRFSGDRNRGDSSAKTIDQQQQEQRRGVAREDLHRIPRAPPARGRCRSWLAHRLDRCGRSDGGRPAPAPVARAAGQFSSFSRSALSMLSLVIAIGVSSTSGSGLVPSRRKLDHGLERLGALAARELLDGGGQAAVADRAQRLGQRVEADDLDVEALLLDHLQRAERHVVVGAEDHVRRLRRGRRGSTRSRSPPRRAGSWRFARRRTCTCRHARRARCGAPLLRSIAGLAPGWPCRLTMVAPSGKSSMISLPCASPPRTLSAPTWARMPGHAVDPAVDGDDRDAGVDRRLQRRRHRHRVERADDDAVDALGDRGLDVGGLLGGLVLAVGLDQRDAADLVASVAQLLLHVHEERELQRRQRRGEGQHPGQPRESPRTTRQARRLRPVQQRVSSCLFLHRCDFLWLRLRETTKMPTHARLHGEVGSRPCGRERSVSYPSSGVKTPLSCCERPATSSRRVKHPPPPRRVLGR